MLLTNQSQTRSNSAIWSEWFKSSIFSELEHVSIKLEPCDSGYDGSSNASNPNPRFRAYEPPPYMTNIDLSVEGGLEFQQLPHKTPGH